ncbi:hypothetical protein NT239_03200 [Chitinibacter sp. SCUT-21]|uniref:hypothetical protein n=1 Tax=Chitinibacter sp. SCUT-21 TaxID=2970891 RepID=UPI0035A738EB
MGLNIMLVSVLLTVSSVASAGLLNAFRGDPPVPKGALKVVDFPSNGICHWLDDATLLCNYWRKDLKLDGDPVAFVTIEHRIDEGIQIQHPQLDGSLLKCVDPKSRRVQIDLKRKGLKQYQDKYAMGIWGQPLQEYQPFRKEERPGWVSTEWGYINPFSCQYYADLPTSGLEYEPGRFGLMLYEDDGVLSKGEWTEARNYKKWKEENPNPKRGYTKVMLEDERVSNSAAIFPMRWLKQGYLVFNRLSAGALWADENPQQIWLLSEGKLQKQFPIMRPEQPSDWSPAKRGWSDRGNSFKPLRSGMLISLNLPPFNWNGLYLAPFGTPEKAIKLSDAVSSTMLVSPNGCRVLLGMQWPDLAGKQEYATVKLKVVDFCKGDE